MGHPNDHASAYQRLRQVSQELHLELSDTINEVSQGTFKVKYTNGIIERWHELQRRLASLCGLQGLELTRALWPPENEDCADLRLKADNIANEFPEPKQLFEALRQEITQPQLPDSKSDIIRVMSLHKSKGLTAALIVVAGCVAGALPTIHTSEPSAVQDFELDEQRRLFYVAITRANETVVISSCIMLPSRDALQNGIQVIGRYRIGGEDWVKTAASPFIADLGVAAPLPVDTATWRAQAGF
jgi:superfamily I DNA/RNA helicase